MNVSESDGVATLTVAISMPPGTDPIETSFILLVNTLDGPGTAAGFDTYSLTKHQHRLNIYWYTHAQIQAHTHTHTHTPLPSVAPGDYVNLTNFRLGPFNNSVRQLSFNVSIVDESIPENAEMFNISLTLDPADQARLDNCVTVSPNVATVTIQDNDGKVSII